MRRSLLLSVSLFIFISFCHSQGTLRGKIIDSATRSVLGLATVTVFKAADTSIITYRLSTPDGEFRVTGIPMKTPSRVIISYSGYEVFRKEFMLDSSATLDLGTIELRPSSSTLEEVLVIAEMPPVTVRKDTIEFNAASFKTLPTALVEDMLRKLPGVQVDGEGNITVNGKRVNRIMVDGKDFFGTDPKMATRNLPANIIDKIQVTEDKDDRELNPDRPEGDIGQVINLKLKKAIKSGWFGKAYAGGGTDDRYEAGTILNLFRDTMQVSVLGFSNNVNRAGFGFNDIRSLGGFDRSGINMLMVNSTGGLNVNGISFGGMGEGINRSTGGGFNMNHVLKNGLTLNTQYFYGQTRNDITELNNREQFLGDTTLITRTRRDEVQGSNNHRIGVALKGKLDSLTRIEFRPGLVFSEQGSDRFMNVETVNNVKGRVNASDNHQDMDARDISYTHSFMYFRNFMKKGRTLNVTNAVNYGNIDNIQVYDMLNTFFLDNGNVENVINQLRDRRQENLNVSLNANFNEPLSKALSLRLGYIGNYQNNQDEIVTFNESVDGKYEVPVLSLTNGVRRAAWRNTFSTGLNWKYKALNVTATANLLLLDINNEFQRINTTLNQHFRYILPALNINWKALNLSYSVSVNPPGITDLQPTPDSTNYPYVFIGNPELKPTTTHSINLNFFKNITDKSIFVSAYLNGSIRNDAVIRARVVEANGVQVSTPVNMDGSHDVYSNFSINKQHKFNSKFQISGGTGYNINYNRSFLMINNRRSFANTFDFGPRIQGAINWNDIIEWNFNYNFGINRTTYENPDFTDLKVNRSGATTELVVRWPKHVVWESNLNYRYNPMTAPGIQSTIYLLNAGVTFLFLKEDKGQLKLSGFDLLNQNTSVFRNTRENEIIDRQINILQRYYMLTFTYNIRSFKGGKVGGRERFFMF